MQKEKISQYDKLTKTPVPRLVLTLSIPAVISMMITTVYNMADTAFVSRFGNSASGAVGIVFGFMSIIQAFGFLFGQGAGSILSRALGSRDQEKASLHASVGFFASFLFGLLVTVFGFLFLDEVVTLLGSTKTIAPYAKTYITYILIASPFMTSSLTLNNFLRYEGKASLGMIGLLTGAILNTVCDPILMFGMKMGVAGAGLSTAVSQVIGWFILFWMFLSGKTACKITFRAAAGVHLAVLGNIAATGFPSLLRQGLSSFATVMLNAQCAVFGDAAIAAMSIESRLVFFAFSIAIGVGQGFQPVSAFNYGAGKFDRLRKAYRFTALASEGIVVVSCAVLIVFAEPLIALFRPDPEVIAIGARALRLHAFATFLLPLCMTTEMMFQSTGRRFAASFLSSLRGGLLLIPLLLILAHFRGITGIQEAQPLALALSLPITVPFAVRFFRLLPRDDGEDKTP